jgi:Basic region leucine zipper
MGSTMPLSGVTYVGDSRSILQNRAVSMGAIRGPQRLGVSPQEEDKRRRAASASARFRRRKKEQEEENLKEIARLEKKIEELKKEYRPLSERTTKLILDVITGVNWPFEPGLAGPNPLRQGTDRNGRITGDNGNNIVLYIRVWSLDNRSEA